MTKIQLAIAVLLAPGVAAAHPDHGSSAGLGIVHLLTDPFHLSLVGGAVLLFFAARRNLLRYQPARRNTR
jgi:hypothetical protein